MALDSAYTSLNQVPAFFKSQTFRNLVAENKVTKILDIGGGKYDKATDYLLEHENIQNHVFDLFNRSERHNNNATIQFKKPVEPGYGKMVVCLNVLNVIRIDDELECVVALCALNANSCKVVFQIYEGNKTGRKSTKTAQRNQITRSYGDIVRKHCELPRN